MMAPAGMTRLSPVIGGGDWRMLLWSSLAWMLLLTAETMPFRSSEVDRGVDWVVEETLEEGETADGVRLCRAKYDEDRGRAGDAGEAMYAGGAGLETLKEGRRLASGEEAADEAGERWEGGV
jgi:hypothetical protein